MNKARRKYLYHMFCCTEIKNFRKHEGLSMIFKAWETLWLRPSHTRVRLSHDFKIGRSDPIFSPIVRSSDPIFRPNTKSDPTKKRRYWFAILFANQCRFLKSRKSMFLTCDHRTIIVRSSYNVFTTIAIQNIDAFF